MIILHNIQEDFQILIIYLIMLMLRFNV